MSDTETEIRICKGNLLEIMQRDYSGKRMKMNYVLVPVEEVKKAIK